MPKYRRKVMYGEKKQAVGEILRKLCDYKKVEILDDGLQGLHPYMCKNTAKAERV
jgi:putative transposase